MRRQYALRSMMLIAGFGLVALAILVQMIRIQNSEQAAIFLSQGDQYAGEFRMFYPERGEIYDRNGATEVQLRADSHVPYGRVAELIGLVQEAGLSRVGFVTEAAAGPGSLGLMLRATSTPRLS